MVLPLLLSAAASGVGSLIQQGEANANAGVMTDAMNKVRDQTLRKNDRIGKKTRGIFDKNVGRYAGYDQVHDKAVDERTSGLMSAVDTAAPEIPMSDTSSGVVQTALAQRMADAIKSGTATAQRAGALGGYGDAWMNLGLKTNAADRNIGVQNDAAAGNMAIMPHLQQLAQARKYKPSSGIGEVIQGAAGAFSGGPPVG